MTDYGGENKSPSKSKCNLNTWLINNSPISLRCSSDISVIINVSIVTLKANGDHAKDSDSCNVVLLSKSSLTLFSEACFSKPNSPNLKPHKAASESVDSCKWFK